MIRRLKWLLSVTALNVILGILVVSFMQPSVVAAQGDMREMQLSIPDGWVNEIPADVVAAITLAIQEFPRDLPNNGTLTLTNFEDRGTWALGSLTSADLSQAARVRMAGDGVDTAITNDNAFSFIMVQDGADWIAAIDTSLESVKLAGLIPDNEFSPSAKSAMFTGQIKRSSVGQAQAYFGYKLPWRVNESHSITANSGWHEVTINNPAQLALDFSRNGAVHDILSSAAGTVTYLCKIPGQLQTGIGITTSGTNETLIYFHLDSGTVNLGMGSAVSQGQVLGRTIMGNITDEVCGYQYGPHVHFVFPERPFTIDGYTFSASSLPSGSLNSTQLTAVGTPTITTPAQNATVTSPVTITIQSGTLNYTGQFDLAVVVSSTSNFAAGTILSESGWLPRSQTTYSANLGSFQGIAYVRAKQGDTVNREGPWSSVISFTVGSPTTCTSVSGAGVKLFDTTNCGGNSISLTNSGDVSLKGAPHNFENIASSIYVSAGYSVRIISSVMYGYIACITSTQSNLTTVLYEGTSINANDDISSLQVFNTPSCSPWADAPLQTYTTANYASTPCNFTMAGWYNISYCGSGWNDNIESFKLLPGWSARFWLHDFKGPSLCFRSRSETDLINDIAFSLDGRNLVDSITSFQLFNATDCQTSGYIYDRTAAWNFANQYQNSNPYGNNIHNQAMAEHFRLVLRAGGQPDLGNVSEGEIWLTNGKPANWLKAHPDRWEWRDSADSMEIGDVIIFGCSNDAAFAADPLWSNGDGSQSRIYDMTIVVSPNTMSGWALPAWNVGFGAYDGASCGGGGTTSAKRYIHIKDTDDLPAQPVITQPSLVTLSGTPSVVEGGTLTYTINVSPVSTSQLTVNYSLSGTATSGNDYTAPSGSVVIPANAASGSISVSTIDDPTDESNETVIVTLTGVSGGTSALGTPVSATGIITDNDDPTSFVSISGTPSVVEGGTLTYTVNVSPTSTSTITVNYSLSGMASSGGDYTAPSGSVVIPANAASASISVSTINDSTDEPDESLIVTLSNVSGGTSLLSEVVIANGTIIDNDDPTSVITISGTPSVVEGGTLTYAVNVSPVSISQLTVNYSLSGTAALGSDYTAPSGSVVIPANASSASIIVSTINDTTDEPDKSLIVTLAGVSGGTSALGATVSATGTIVDDDDTVTSLVTISGTSSVVEGGALTYTVNVSPVSTSQLTVNYDLSGTATSGSDYTAPSGSVVIPANASSASITVSTINDSTDEPDKTVIIELTSVTGGKSALGATVSVTGTIIDDDVPVVVPLTVSIADSSGLEGNTVNGLLNFTVSLSRVDAQAVQVGYVTTNGTALAGQDFQSTNGIIAIPAGQTSGIISVMLIGDVIIENNETFSVTLFNPSVAALGDFSGTGTLLDDDTSADNLLTNSGFEVGTTPWQIKRASGTKANDKVVCSSVGAAGSPCAFVFTGNASENTSLIQTVLDPVITLNDQLYLRTAYSTKIGAPKITIKVKVFFTNGTSKSAVVLPATSFGRTTTTATPAYVTVGGWLPSTMSAQAVSRLQVTVAFKSTSGKLNLDDLSLLSYASGTRTDESLPLPLP